MTQMSGRNSAGGARAGGTRHRPGKAACIRKPACRKGRRQGPGEFLGIINIQLVSMNIQLGRDLQIGP